MSGKSACLIIILIITALLSVNPADARENIQRELFLKAEKHLENGRKDEFRALLPELEDYPLYPYLEYQLLVSDLSLEKESEILRFMTREPS
ncbi:MAG: hypothetical protein ACOCV7_03630, partial [Desulfonatronovibrionaceae bacterium]